MTTKIEILAALAEIYGEELTDSRAKAYLAFFKAKGLGVDDLRRAFTEIISTTDQRRFPLPAEIFQAAFPSASTDDEAKDAAARVVHAVSKFGWANREEARKYIGELGWEVVERQGGWQSICETMKPAQIGIFQAQFRELAKTVYRKSANGQLHDAPRLPAAEKRLTGNLTPIGGLIGALKSQQTNED